MSYKINHVKQPCQKSCVSACIAMITDRTIESTIELVHQPYLDDKVTSGSILRSMGLSIREPNTCDRFMAYGNLYILAVPSLNHIAGTHVVLADFRDQDSIKVYDPQKGNPGRKYYTWGADDSDEMAIKIGGLSIEVEIVGYDAWMARSKL